MLEDDPLKKSLIHGYGSRGIALARLDDVTDDEELNDLARRVAFHEDDDEDPDTPDQPFTTIKVNFRSLKFTSREFFLHSIMSSRTYVQ